MANKFHSDLKKQLNECRRFRKHAHQAVEWVADYQENIETYPVKSQVKPKEIYDQISDLPPAQSESFSKLIKDLEEKIMPGTPIGSIRIFMRIFRPIQAIPL